MEFYYCLNQLCEATGCSFDTAFLVGVWGFAILFYVVMQYIIHGGSPMLNEFMGFFDVIGIGFALAIGFRGFDEFLSLVDSFLRQRWRKGR